MSGRKAAILFAFTQLWLNVCVCDFVDMFEFRFSCLTKFVCKLYLRTRNEDIQNIKSTPIANSIVKKKNVITKCELLPIPKDIEPNTFQELEYYKLDNSSSYWVNRLIYDVL